MIANGSRVQLVRDTYPMGKSKDGSSWPALSAGTEYIVLGSYTNSREQFAGTWYKVKSVVSGVEFEFHQDIVQQV